MKSLFLILLSLLCLQFSYGQYATPVINSYSQVGQLIEINGNNFGKTQDHQYTTIQVITPLDGLKVCSNVLISKNVIKCNLPTLYYPNAIIRITVGYSRFVPQNSRPILSQLKIDYNLYLKVVAKVLDTTGTILPSNGVNIDLLYISPSELINQVPIIKSINNSTNDNLKCSTVSNFKTICDTPSEYGLHTFKLTVNTQSTIFDYVILQQQ